MRVLVAMSGGVDSSVAALLLKEQGYDVVGATFRLWVTDKTEREISDAKRVCEKLGIEHYVCDWEKEFKEMVVEPFVGEYLAGRTPNPCIFCNKRIKYGLCFDFADKLGCEYISTGHYGKVESDGCVFHLKKSENLAKDQSYVLYNLGQEQLKRIILPLSHYSKDEVRAIAERHGLCVARKSDSQDICFIPDGNHMKFIESYLGRSLESGHFVDIDGNVLGVSKHISNYTIGQRKGLGISLSKPMYVYKIDAEKNEVTLVGDESKLYHREISVKNVNYVEDMGTEPFYADVKIRYSQRVARALVYPNGDKALVKFEVGQRAPTSGQSLVGYNGDILLFGGIIE